MRRPLIAVILGVVLPTVILFSVTRKVRAAGPTFTTIDFPGACATIATGINYSGTIVGDFAPTCKLPEVVHGYVLSQGTFKEFDFPGATFTRPLGINDAGEIVGLYRDSKQGKDHGFLLSGGTFTTIDFPSAIATEVWGQDRGGQIAGRYQDANGVFHIFLLSNGSFASIDFPGAAETAPSFYGADGGFNAGGDIASGHCSAEPCANPSPSVHSFLLKDGQFVSFDPPGTLGSFALGTNSIDEIVGAYVGQDGHYHGYLRTP